MAEDKTGNKLVNRVVLIGGLLLLFVPYPTQVSPPLNLQIVDEQGVGFGSRSVTWEGGFYASYFEQRVRLDRGGRLTLPARRAWKSAILRFDCFLNSFMPHSGGRAACATVYFNVPAGYEFDPAPTGSSVIFDSGGGPPNGRIRWWNLPNGTWYVDSNEGMREGGEDSLGVSTDHPSRWGTSTYRLVLRKKSGRLGQ